MKKSVFTLSKTFLAVAICLLMSAWINRTFGQTTWSLYNPAPSVIRDIEQVQITTGPNTYQIFAVGDDGLVQKINAEGGAWTVINSGVTTDFKSFSAYDKFIFWAAGEDKVLRTTNGGSTWSTATIAGLPVLNSISMFDINVGWVVGASGKIFKTTNGGATWTAQTSNTTNTLYKILAEGPSDAIAVGANGTICRTSNGGTTWTVSTFGDGTKDLYSITAVNLELYAAGEGGTIIKSIDGGGAWGAQTSGTTSNLLDIASYDVAGNKGFYACGNAGALVRSTNGAAWSTVATGRTDNFLTIANIPSTPYNFYLATSTKGFMSTFGFTTCSAPATTMVSSNITACLGDDITITTTSTGTMTARSLKKDGVAVNVNGNTSALGNVITLTNVQPSQTGTYLVEVTSPCGNATTASITITVNDTPAQPSTITIDSPNPSQSIQYNLSVTNVAGTTYTWNAGTGGTITGTGNAVSVSWSTTGAKTVTVTPSNSCGTGTPRTMAINVAAPLAAPTLFPADNATNVSISANLNLTFSESFLSFIPGKVITIRRTADNSVFESYTLASTNVTKVNGIVTINPTANFQESTGYYVQIEGGSITIPSAPFSGYTGILTATGWNFTTTESTPPVITAYSPVDNATGVNVSSNLVATFSENIFAVASKIITIKKLSDHSVVASYTLPSANVVVSGNTVAINPSSDLAASTDYYVNMDAGSFEDAAGNDFAGIVIQSTWNFVTTAAADVTPPTITTLSPLDNATGVAVASNLVATFSENVTAVATKVVSIRRVSDNAVFESYTLPSTNVTVSGATVTINPTGSFANSIGYYVNMDAGAFEDAAGNDFVGIANTTSWSFTTEAAADGTPPTISTLSPLDNATGVAVASNLIATFSENITAVATKVVSIRRASDNAVFESYTLPSGNVVVSGTTVTINPTGSLANSVGYYVNMDAGAFEDAAGNDFAGITNTTFWSFTTVAGGDVTPPTITSFSPTDNATVVPVNTNLVMTFSENVNVVSSKIVRMYRLSDNQEFETIVLPDARVSASGSTVTINPSTDFSYSTGYFVFVEGGAFEDVAGNDFAGFFDNATWNFTTAAPADATPPNLISVSPVDNATGVSVSSNFVLTFSENVAAGSSKAITIRRSSDGNPFENYLLPHANVSISGATVTVNPSGTLVNSLGYYITIEPGAIEDLVGNDFAGFADNATWNFTTEAVALQNQTITFNALAAKTFGDAAFGLTATASSGLPVSYTSSNTAVATVSGSTVTIVGAGTTTITASQAGNGSFNPAPAVQQTLTVNKANQTITFGALAAKTFGDANFTLSATASSSLGVSYSSSNTAVATVSGNTVTVVGAGSTTITASQAGNANFNAATNVQQTLTVNKANQTITFSALAAKTFGDANFTLSATASSSLGVSYSSSNTAVATVSGNLVTIVGAGSTFITASQGGNSNFNVAADVQQTLTVNKANQTITFGALPGKQTGDAAFSLTATASSGLTVSYASSNTAVATVSGSTVTVVGAGSTTITAAQSGNANFNAATPVNQILSVTNSDTQPPTITLLSPLDNATAVPIDANLVITFSENIIVGSGSLRIRYVSDNSLFSQISTVGAVISGNTLTINTSDFEYGAQYYVDVDPGYVKDASNNLFAGLVGNPNWTFTTVKLDQTITFGSLATKTFGETAFNLTASASSGLPVSYSSSNTSVATISSNTVVIVGAGSTIITASQAGNSTYNAASNVQQTLTVNKENQTITFSALPSKTFGDASFTLGATASSGLSVSYTSSNTAVATISGNTVTIVGAGSTTITASQGGNANFNAATNVQQTLTVNKASQAITFSAVASKTFGDASFTLGATASSGLPVSYTSSNTAIATISGNTVTIVGAGSTTITASQAGNSNYNPATNVQQILTVNKANQTVTFSALTTKTFGDVNFALSATASSGLSVSYVSSNAAVATISGNTVTIVGAGSTTITASQVGNANYNTATNVAQILTVNKAGQTISFTAIPSKTLGDPAFGLVATASSGLPLTFSSGNLSVATISGSILTIVGAGTSTISATQVGNANYNSISVDQILTVANPILQNQTITFSDLPTKTFGNAAFTLSASASSGLAVSFTSSNTSVVTITGNTATIVGAGNATISAQQSGNAAFNAAPVVQQLLTVNKAVQTLTFGTLITKTFGDVPYTITASSTSGLPVSFSSSNTLIASIAGNTITVVGAGSTTITASQGGDANYQAASTVVQPITVNKANQSITFGSLAAKGVNDPPFSLTGTASSGLTVTYTSSNTAVATVSGSTVTLVGQGTTTITAVQSGNTNYNAAASVGQSLTVNAKQSQTISFAALPSKTLNDAAFGLSATASSGLAVNYTSSNTAVATISGSTVTIVGAGATTITAAQAGDGTFNAAPSVQQTLNVNKLDQTIFFTALGSKQLSEGTITLAATATSGLAVTYTSSNPTVATVSGSTLTLLSAGNTTITAIQSGNDNYNAATNINNELVVSDKQAQTITFAALASKTIGDAAFTLNATASSGLTVSYTSSNSAVATISGNTVTLVGAGSVTIHANQAGSATFSAATQVSQSFCVNPTKPVIAATGLNTNAPVLKSSSATGNQWFKNTELLPGATNEALSITGPGVYKVRVSAGSCISAFSDDFAVIVTGDLSTQAQVSIYPNPATHLLQVSLPEDGQVHEVSVFNLQGQRLEAHQVQSTSVQVDVQPYAPGPYLLQVSTGRQQQIIRFIKK